MVVQVGAGGMLQEASNGGGKRGWYGMEREPEEPRKVAVRLGGLEVETAGETSVVHYY